MLDNIVVIPLEISNEDLIIIVEISKKLNIPRNETIRMLIRLGLQTLLKENNIKLDVLREEGGDKS